MYTQYLLNEINSMLLDLILSLPFPFTKELRSQIESATIETLSQPGYYRMDFQVLLDSEAFPNWLISVPLSFHLPRSGASYQCVLTQNSDGHIKSFEIISMDLSNIDWEDVKNSSPIPDYEFDIDYLNNLLLHDDSTITPILVDGTTLLLRIEKRMRMHFLLFLNCEFRILQVNEQIFSSKLHIYKRMDIHNVARYTLCADDRKIDFDYSMLLEHKNLLV